MGGGLSHVEVKDVAALHEDELHYLVLEEHVEGHVATVHLGPHEGGAEHDADALAGHQVLR